MEPKNYGLIIDPIKPDDYVAGSSNSIQNLRGEIIVQPGGQWLDWIPQGEQQAPFGFEPSACASFGTLNAVEILLQRVYGEIDNFSDRFLARMSNTTQSGNSPHTVAETLRKKGDVKEQEWPYTSDLNTWEKFYSEIPDTTQILALGEFAEYEFKHEYVPTAPASLMTQLQYSPLGIAVSAWEQDATGLYVSNFPANHWVALIGYVKNEYWIVYDTYTDFTGGYLKKLAWNHNFPIAKKYSIKIQITNPNAFTRFINFLKSWLGL